MDYSDNTTDTLTGELSQDTSDAFGYEISLKFWRKKEWMKIEKLQTAELEQFRKEVFRIQKEGIIRFSPKVKQITNPTGLDVGYNLSGPLYEIIVGRTARVFIGTEEHSPARLYLMYVDPSHKICG